MEITEKGIWKGTTKADHGWTVALDYGWSPKLANWIASVIPNDRTVYDFGCGPGNYLKVLYDKGFECMGFEGDPTPLDQRAFNGILKADISEPMKYLKKWHKGHVVCLETMEHIPAQYMQTALDNINVICNGRLVMSWAIVGQGGRGHFNEMNNPEVIAIIEPLGFKKNDTLTEEGRKYVDDWAPYFRNTVMVFDRI
jgi:SAM-dependent methyltransferase